MRRKPSLSVPPLRTILLVIVASYSLTGCKSEKAADQPADPGPKNHATGVPASPRRGHSHDFDSILGGKDLSKVDWKKVQDLAANDMPAFEEFLDHSNKTLEDVPETRDEFFSRSIWFVRDLDTKEVVKLIEQHGKGQAKKEAYASLIGTYAEDPGRLKGFVEQMPYGEPRTKGFQRYYIIATKSVADFESGLRTLAETDSQEDRKGIRMGLKQSGESLISSGQTTSDQLNSLITKALGEQKNPHETFNY